MLRPTSGSPSQQKIITAILIKSEGEILLLAEDIIQFTEIEKENDLFNFISDSFEHTYWISGNHCQALTDQHYKTSIYTFPDERLK